MTENYKDVVKELYNERFPSDDPGYVYSLRNPIGLYQRGIIIKNLIDILNRNGLSLSNFNSILDLGCGVGIWLRFISEVRGNARGLIGIDLSEHRLRHAISVNDNIQWIKADMCALPFDDKSFDLVIAFTSFMFLMDQVSLRIAIRESSRVLKSNGFLIFYDILGNERSSEVTRSFHIGELNDLFASAGFSLIDMKTCFKRILGLRKLSTAYLGSKVPMEILLLLERFPIAKPSNILALFRK